MRNPKPIPVTPEIIKEAQANTILRTAQKYGWTREGLSKAIKKYKLKQAFTSKAIIDIKEDLQEKQKEVVNNAGQVAMTPSGWEHPDKVKKDSLKSHRVLVIGDTHIPFEHPRYFEFIRQTYDEFTCDTVVHIGDLVDNHAISYHEHNPDGLSPGDELKQAIRVLETKWYKYFPNVRVCMGNHDELIYRKGVTNGLPKSAFLPINQLLHAPSGWVWDFTHELDHVLYQHGTGTSGKTAHITRSLGNRQSTVIGHVHSHAGVAYTASQKDLIFGMNVGCGLNIRSYAMLYGKDFVNRPTLGCGIVLEGKQAIFVPMNLGTKILYKGE